MRKYFIKDVIEKGHNLEPLHCKYCDSEWVVFHQYVGDAVCEECGEWQLEN